MSICLVRNRARALRFDGLEDRRLLSVSPPSFMATLEPGESTGVIDKVVQTPEIPPDPDIAFLSDTTGSMGSEIANVQSNASTIVSTIVAAQPTAQFSVSEYRDLGDFFGRFQVNQSLTANTTDVVNAINGWSPGGGGDTPEAQLPALRDLAVGAATWRAGSSRIIVWFGDEPGHDPRDGVDLATATTALQAAGVQVVAVNVRNLDSTGQATHITNATGGSLESDATGVSNAILSGLGNLPITVVPVPVGCGPLQFNFDAASKTVTSGDPVSFDETISVPDGTPEQEVHCEVEFQDTNGNVIGTQEIWIDINSPPEANDDLYVVLGNNTISVPAAGILANDTDPGGDPLTVGGVVDDVDNGTLGVNPDGSFSYTPNTDFAGADTFTYFANDGDADSNIATVTIQVLQLELTPEFETNELGSDNEHTVTATVLGDPAYIAANPRVIDFSVAGQNAGAIGVCSVNADCSTDAGGQVSFTYSVAVAPSSLGTDFIAASMSTVGDEEPAEQEVTDEVLKEWVDTTPPVPRCVESVNPHGEKTPPAGTGLPGPNGGQNEDGFYRLLATDDVWPEEDIEIFVNGFGPFAVDDVIKYTQADGAEPKMKKMGSSDGEAGAVAAHIVGNGDMTIVAVDGSGNASDPHVCLVPRPPK